MKNLRNYSIGAICLLLLSFLALSSCNNDDSGSGAAPVITSVSASVDEDGNAIELTPTTVGYAANMYIIHGSGFSSVQKIYFNEKDTYFNPTLVTDTEIFVTIDRNTPYADATDELKVETLYGTATFGFVVAPPAPALASYNPINAAAGETITIYGSFFLDPVVTFGATQATIVSSSLTQLEVIVPEDANYKYITVTTISGASTSRQAVGTAIYDDTFYAPWTIEAWNNHEYVTDQAKAYQGTTFIKKAINGWDNIQGNWAWDDQLSQYTGIRFALRSDDPGKLVWIVNGNGWGMDSHAISTTTDWKEVRLTWADLGGMPAALQNLSFQEFTGAAHNYYIDDIGFTVD
jgi:hypothetical protein